MRKANRKRLTLIAASEAPADKPPQTSDDRTYKIKKKEKAEKLSQVIYDWMLKKKNSLGPDIKIQSHEYEIGGFIREGTFGKVLMAVNVNTKLTAAAKIERINTQCPQLYTEYQIYQRLGCEIPGFIKIYHYGTCTKNFYNVLVMELLGPDLENLFVTCNMTFSRKTVLMIAIQTIRLMKHIHKCKVIYRDVKPENFCIGTIVSNKEKIIHVIDFGLAQINGGSKADTSSNVTESVAIDYLIGTARYMSINAHFAFDQSARDDLESLGYMLIYFLKGRLPWMGLSRNGSIEDHYRGIAHIKTSTSPEELIGEYEEFSEYLQYVRKLKNKDTPNYEYLIKLMKNALKSQGFKEDNIFDWHELMNQRYLKQALKVDPDS